MKSEQEIENWINDLLKGKKQVIAQVVGCDFPHGVADVKGEEFDDYFEPLEKYHAYEFDEIYGAQDGEDITQLVIAKIKRIKSQKEATEKRNMEMEGAIAFNRCWECGRVKIVGKMTREGYAVRMPRDEWIQAQKALEQAWEKMLKRIEEENAGPLSSVGASWMKDFESLGFKAVIISEDYDGC